MSGVGVVIYRFNDFNLFRSMLPPHACIFCVCLYPNAYMIGVRMSMQYFRYGGNLWLVKAISSTFFLSMLFLFLLGVVRYIFYERFIHSRDGENEK